jgi:hypothetical protein
MSPICFSFNHRYDLFYFYRGIGDHRSISRHISNQFKSNLSFTPLKKAWDQKLHDLPVVYSAAAISN